LGVWGSQPPSVIPESPLSWKIIHTYLTLWGALTPPLGHPLVAITTYSLQPETAYRNARVRA